MGREFELKFRASVRQMEAIREAFDGFREISMESTYYDTPERALRPLHWSLRQRIENGVSVCTLKTPCEEGGRNEWEAKSPDIQSGISELCRIGAPEELSTLVAGGLEAVCSARFIRQAALIELEDCTLELALDRGILRGKARIELLGEVELELKSGSEDAAIAFARKLMQTYGLRQEFASKYARALALAGE